MQKSPIRWVQHQHPWPSILADGRVRLKVSELEATTFIHNFSFLDDQVHSEAPKFSPAAGCTEWIGKFGSASISVGWDWYLDAHHQIQLLRAVAPRSNLCVIDPKGYDLEDEPATQLLFDFLKANFWHQTVRQVCNETLQLPSH